MGLFKNIGAESNIELSLPLGGSKKSCYYDKRTDTTSIYFHSDIGNPVEYRKIFRALDSAKEGSKVNVYIACNGGDLDTTVALMEHIKNCKGHTRAYVAYACSAATAIALSCDGVYLYDHGYFMVHNFSAYSEGKGQELKAKATFEEAWTKALFEDVYKDFLTPEEVEQVRNDKDFWILTQECRGRLKNCGKL